MILELFFIIALLAAIAVMGYYLWKCNQPDSDSASQMASRAKPMHPAVAGYQQFLRSVSLPEYEYKMYEAFTPESPPKKKYNGFSREQYTLADYDKVPNCSCKNLQSCVHGSKSRGWSPSSDTI